MPSSPTVETSPAWVKELAAGREPGWTPLLCGALALVGWLGPTLAGLPDWLAGLAFAGAYVAGGFFSLFRTFKSLRERKLDIDLLMLLSAAGAAAIGEVAEGEVDPLLCPFCGAEMRVLAFILDFGAAKAIRMSLKLPAQEPEPLAHAPPATFELVAESA